MNMSQLKYNVLITSKRKQNHIKGERETLSNAWVRTKLLMLTCNTCMGRDLCYRQFVNTEDILRTGYTHSVAVL